LDEPKVYQAIYNEYKTYVWLILFSVALGGID